MAPIKCCVVAAFADSAFQGNPAAVCLLPPEENCDDVWLQAVARELNQPVTSFLTWPPGAGADDDAIPRFHIRWFTPVAEVDVCGHATLAAAHFLFTHEVTSKSDVIEFVSSSAEILTARKISKKLTTPKMSDPNGAQFTIELDFPTYLMKEYHGPIEASSISKTLNGAFVTKVFTSPHDFVFVLPSGKDVVDAVPNFEEMLKFPGRGIVITGLAPTNSKFDFFTRVFAPNKGVNEDQVCASAHCALAPYWGKKLGKSNLIACQASTRGAVLNLHVDDTNKRVLLKGGCIMTMEGLLLV